MLLNILTRVYKLRRYWLLSLLLVFSICAQAQIYETGEFSSREAITERQEALQLEMAEAGLADSISLNHPLQQLNVATYRHLEVLETLAVMVERAALAKEDLNSWNGFG